MSLGDALRTLAFVCLVASMPLACVKYPWMPATVMEFVELQRDPSPQGTASYHAARSTRLQGVGLALTLYALGTISQFGLSIVATKAAPRWIEVAAWAIVAVTGIGIARFEQPTIQPTMASAYLVIAVYIPLGIVALAGPGALATLHLMRSERAARPVLGGRPC
jgi:small neutral amino acid transporter SnatA (MarC family)